jgi:hypothetical protein
MNAGEVVNPDGMPDLNASSISFKSCDSRYNSITNVLSIKTQRK